MYKIKTHPLFFALLGYFAITGKLQMIVGYLVAIVAHEIAHAQIARLRGYQMGTVTLMPFGGVLDGGGGYNPQDNLIIALAGPIFNAFFAVVCVAVWWVFPDMYRFTMDICIANIAMCIVNLMPLYPLDGSRILLSLIKKNKLKAIKWLKISSIAFGTIITMLGIVLIVMAKGNFSIAIMGIFLVYSAFVKADEESYLHISKSNFLNKSFDSGLKKSVIYVTPTCQLYRLLSYVNPAEYCEFIVMQDGKIAYTINETQLGELCVTNDLCSTLQETTNNINDL